MKNKKSFTSTPSHRTVRILPQSNSFIIFILWHFKLFTPNFNIYIIYLVNSLWHRRRQFSYVFRGYQREVANLHIDNIFDYLFIHAHIDTIQENFQDFYWLFGGLITNKWSMRPYFAKVSIGTGFEPVLNWLQSTALTALLQLLHIFDYLFIPAYIDNTHWKRLRLKKNQLLK